MKRIVITFYLTIMAVISAYAEVFSYTFDNIPVSQALMQVVKEHPELSISFIYNELENYRTDCAVRTDDPVEAIRLIAGYNPISVMVVGDRIYVEALQRGRYRYTGRIVDSHGETIPFATVMLLSPKDSTVITYGTSGTDGYFLVPCDSRNVIAKVSGVGYRTAYHKCSSFNLGDLMLQPSSINLKGVTVEARNASVSSDRSVYTPTARQKRVSQDATDLLKVMSIPELRVDWLTNAVTDNFGKSVPIFINYMKASGSDLTGMRTADVRRVEFINAPTDPRFQGEAQVINFIVEEYEYGGYTKSTVKEGFMTGLASDASVFSKFAYRQMTYDLYAGAKNQNDHHNGSSTDAEYSLINSDGDPYVMKRMEKMDDSHFIQNQYPVTFRASYNGKKMQIRNTIGFTYLWKPENNENGSLGYQPSLGTDYEYSRVYTKRNNSFSYSGSYFFVLPGNFSLSVGPKFSYSRIKDNTDYSTTTADAPVINNAFEKAYSVRVDACLNKQFDKKNSISAGGAFVNHYNNILYRGSDNSRSVYDLYAAFGKIGYNFKSKKLSLNADFSIIWERNDINGKIINDYYPATHLQAGYAFNSKNKLGIYFQIASFTPEISDKSPNVLKQNELMYIAGNPDLKNYRVSTFDLGYTWLPTNAFNVNIYGSYYGLFGRKTVSYTHYDGGKALLRSYINDGDYNRVYTGISFNWKLLDGHLVLNANPEMDFYRVTGIYARNMNSFFLKSSAAYYFGNFYLQGNFKLRMKTLKEDSDIIERSRNQYQFTFGWSNGDLNLRLSASNIFSKGWLRYTREFESPLYSECRRVYAPSLHPSISLAAVYTFGYGKKVKRGNEIGEQSGASSAILK